MLLAVSILVALLSFVMFGFAGIIRLFRIGDRELGIVAVVLMFLFAPAAWIIGIAAFFRDPKPGSALDPKRQAEARHEAQRMLLASVAQRGADGPEQPATSTRGRTGLKGVAIVGWAVAALAVAGIIAVTSVGRGGGDGGEAGESPDSPNPSNTSAVAVDLDDVISVSRVRCLDSESESGVWGVVTNVGSEPHGIRIVADLSTAEGLLLRTVQTELVVNAGQQMSFEAKHRSQNQDAYLCEVTDVIAIDSVSATRLSAQEESAMVDQLHARELEMAIARTGTSEPLLADSERREIGAMAAEWYWLAENGSAEARDAYTCKAKGLELLLEAFQLAMSGDLQARTVMALAEEYGVRGSDLLDELEYGESLREAGSPISCP